MRQETIFYDSRLRRAISCTAGNAIVISFTRSCTAGKSNNISLHFCVAIEGKNCAVN